MGSGLESKFGEWSGPAAWRGVRFSFWRLLRAMIVPPKGQRILPTISGYLLIVIAIGMGMAAYNAGSNVLFIALSLLLASLVTSGILSWINFHGLCWRIVADPPFRAGEECRVRIEIRNMKKRIPSYALSVQVLVKKSRLRILLVPGQRIDPQGSVHLDFVFSPVSRGLETISVNSVISQFPFGFLRKSLGGRCSREVMIWPARIPYRFQHAGAMQALFNGDSLNRPGQGSEFVNLRDYRPGDSHRHVHWKASARLRTLVVQQYAAENKPGFVFSVQSPEASWRREEQFEKLCSFVSTLAEDLHRRKQLHGVYINNGGLLRVNRQADYEMIQNQLAVLERVERVGPHPQERDLVTFEADETSGIHAYIGGQKAATV